MKSLVILILAQQEIMWIEGHEVNAFSINKCGYIMEQHKTKAQYYNLVHILNIWSWEKLQKRPLCGCDYKTALLSLCHYMWTSQMV